MQGLPQPPAPSAPVSPYQPAKGFDKTKLAYSFERWLMIGIILIIAATLFVQVVTMWGPPDEPAADASLEELSQYLEDVDGYTDLNRVVSSMGIILQTVGMGLIGYALLRESHTATSHHTALRVTGLILGVLVVANLAARSLNIL